jgi:hypothetical protein
VGMTSVRNAETLEIRLVLDWLCVSVAGRLTRGSQWEDGSDAIEMSESLLAFRLGIVNRDSLGEAALSTFPTDVCLTRV